MSRVQRRLDKDTGLVFTENAVDGTRNASPNWIFEHQQTAHPLPRSSKEPSIGVRSLRELALDRLVRASDTLTVESLQYVSWVWGVLIWQQIEQRHLTSFHLWRVFAAVYGSEFADMRFSYNLEIKQLSTSLPNYLTSIDSVHWSSCLRVSPKQLSTADLVILSKVKNLTVLELSDGQLHVEYRDNPLDERVWRTWYEQAFARQAFQSLRVLMLGWQENINFWLFSYLSSFPKLGLLLITDCRNIEHKNRKNWEEEAALYGWKFLPSKRGTKQLRSIFELNRLSKASTSSLYYDTMASMGKSNHKPVIECTLGSPRRWTHVIEEYPGTRTVYFYKDESSITNTVRQPVANTPRISPSVGHNKTAVQLPKIRKSSQRDTGSLLAQMM